MMFCCILRSWFEHIWLYSCTNRVILLDLEILYQPCWKYHIDYVASKIGKTIGIFARLRHYVLLNTLLNLYRSLISPYLYYGLVAWGQAANFSLTQITRSTEACPSFNIVF